MLLLVLVMLMIPVSALQEATVLPDFSAYVWHLVPDADIQENASYSVYSWRVPADIAENALPEYLGILMEYYHLEELAKEENPSGTLLMAAFSLPGCESLGFRTSVGTQAVKGIHVLWVWKPDPVQQGAGTLFLYAAGGIGFSDTSNRTRTIASPTPAPTPEPTPEPTPAPTAEPGNSQRNVPDNPSAYLPYTAPKSVCTFCNGKGYRDCLTCGGDGYMEIRVSVPNYTGVSGSTSTIEKKPCSNLFCEGGRVKCWYCDGTGEK